MTRTKLELAVLNNVHWYQAMFAAHGLASHTDARVWRSCETPPRFHSNLVVLSPATRQADVEGCIAEIGPRLARGWSLKDSYACLDLTALGFAQLFQASWIWRDAQAIGAVQAATRLTWARVASPRQLADWERAWSGDPGNAHPASASRQFPDRLLGSADHGFFAGMAEGRVVAGGIANRSPGVVGLSNVFSPPALANETWSAMLSGLATAFPGLPVVGYERGADLQLAQDLGFESLGALRVWCHEPSQS
jgi:hypothetical protein